MKNVTAFLTVSVLVAGILFLAPIAAWAGSFGISGPPVSPRGLAGPPRAHMHHPLSTAATVTQQTAVIIITNPDARPLDHLPFLHPFVQTFDVPRSVVVIETDVSVSAANGNAPPIAGQWVWQPGQWVWSGYGWAWWPGRWVWMK